MKIYTDFIEDEMFGERLLVSVNADQRELSEHIWQVRPFELSKYIARRKADFISGMMEACYVVYNGEAVVVNAMYQTRKEIESIINELKP